jgi:hypothetical protein
LKVGRRAEKTYRGIPWLRREKKHITVMKLGSEGS